MVLVAPVGGEGWLPSIFASVSHGLACGLQTRQGAWGPSAGSVPWRRAALA